MRSPTGSTASRRRARLRPRRPVARRRPRAAREVTALDWAVEAVELLPPRTRRETGSSSTAVHADWRCVRRLVRPRARRRPALRGAKRRGAPRAAARRSRRRCSSPSPAVRHAAEFFASCSADWEIEELGGARLPAHASDSSRSASSTGWREERRVPGVELERLDAEHLTGEPRLPLGPDRPVAQGHDRGPSARRAARRHGLDAGLRPEPVERPTRHPRRRGRDRAVLAGGLEVGPERAAELVPLRAGELGVEPGVDASRPGRARRGTPSPGAATNGIVSPPSECPTTTASGCGPDDRGVVVDREPDLVARQVGRPGLVAAPLELGGEPLEAPAAVPGTVHEHEPGHAPSIADLRCDTMLGGVLTAIVTPFDERGAIDFDAFQALARHLVDNGSDGLVVAGTTGESADHRATSELLDLVRAAIEAVGERATVVANTGHVSTAHSVELTERAHEAGADAFLVVTPYYIKPPQRGIVAHFEAIAAATDRPIVAYNIPSRVVVDIEPETISRLAEIPNVRAVKQAHPDPDEARHIVAYRPRSLRRRRRPAAAVPRARRRRRHPRPLARRRPAGRRAGAGVQRRRRRPRPRDRRRAAPRLRPARDHDEPDPDQGRARTCSATTSAATACRSCRRPADELDRVRDCLVRLGLLVAA